MRDDQGNWIEEPLAAHEEQPAATFEQENPQRPAVKPPQQVLHGESAGGATEAPSEVDAAPRLTGRRRGRRAGKRLVLSKEPGARNFSPEQRLLILDTWRRSGLPAGDFAALVDLSKHTLYAWKNAFDRLGPAGLLDQPRGAKTGSHLPELTKRAILMLKETNPDWGCQRISDALARGPALPASAAAVSKLLHESGYELEEVATHRHPDKPRSFERAAPNQLWQSDLFTFVLKRQNRRVYLVAFMDDHSRFLVSYGLHASQSAALVLEVLRAGIASFGAPQEVLTDNGTQYVTWRGKSAFSRELESRGIAHIVARPRHPQTLGKIERFWGTLWRECVESAIFLDLEDARRRIGLFIDHYNFQRPHQGIEGLVPADRFFGAAAEMLATLKARVAANALALARQGIPKPPFYMAGQVAGQTFSLHAEGERVILTRGGSERQEVELVSPAAEGASAQALPIIDPPLVAAELPLAICPDGSPQTPLAQEGMEEPQPPGVSPLDEQFPPAAADQQGAESEIFMAQIVADEACAQEVRHDQ